MRVLMMIVLSLASVAAWAQPKPALVQDRDESARQPWSQRIIVQQNAANCGTPLQNCIVAFDPVPAGKRLVVTYASVVFEADDTVGLGVYTGPLQLPNFGHVVPVAPLAPGRYAGAGPILYYVEAGSSAYFSVETAALRPNAFTRFALTGHFIDLP